MSAEWKPIRKDGKRECPACTNAFKADPTGQAAVVAHWQYRDRPHGWCPGGAAPAAPRRRTRPLATTSRLVT